MPKPHTIYSDAPDLLLNKLIEVEDLLQKSMASNGKTKSLEFWLSVSQVMKYAWNYINDIGWILENNKQLTLQNRFLMKEVSELEVRLNQYETIRDLKLSGEMDQVINRVDNFLNDLKTNDFLIKAKELKDGRTPE